ncbi:DNA-binding protein [Megasphaera cerevisiae DSM 20462]|uniref:DNA-binding protein n=1 Tax=Megasphaera cerevisiae DSM 20462 TaxID=1122219 RepID=A0A0J6X077_9FIRM|nr:DUF134 domain-containing protein [Megasphaera cerevisiae]KMO87532.1 DNA-binding protein [Megasphaera cerevisiae DSM 20462]OKY54282.1 DNA-binding protein [Megasphaera cerevisiae]SJZ52879.1 Predicted DNA-binding protein, UPF0251 family [Megasphaera cerevisiae DSM 20462]
MPRPQRCRRVCSLPKTGEFAPSGCTDNTAIIMGIDEYEVIRLIDWIGLTQEQCAAQINVSRTTVTGIYDSARRKLADALVHGKRLLIEGGHIELCKHAGSCCHTCCHAGKSIHKGE